MKCSLCGRPTVEGADKCFVCASARPKPVREDDSLLSTIRSARGAKSQEEEIVYAGFWLRFFAWILDATIIILPITILSIYYKADFIAYSVKASELIPFYAFYGVRDADLILPPFIFSLFCLFIYLFFDFTLRIFLETSSLQATPGKLLFGIAVSDLRGQPLSIPRELLRIFSQYIIAVPLFVGLYLTAETKNGLYTIVGLTTSVFVFVVSHLMIAFTSTKQALHDRIARTLVFPHVEYPRRRFIASLFFCCSVFGAALWILIFQGSQIVATARHPKVVVGEE